MAYFASENGVKRLKKAQKEKGLTSQQAWADTAFIVGKDGTQVQISLPTLKRLLGRGEQGVSAEALKAICKAVGIDDWQNVVDWERTTSEEEPSPNKKSSPKPTPITPQKLPDMGATNFLGRDAELAELHTLLQQGQRVAISGYGGLGKTELAFQYAKQHQTSYPGGMCWLNGAEDATADLASQLLQFALIYLQMSMPDTPKTEAGQLQYLWRNWPDQGDVLLVIDDLADYAKFKDLQLNQPRFKVLITTRKHLGPPVHRLELATLNPEQALALLKALVENANRIEREKATAEELCRWLGNLPLGVELVGRYLHRDSSLKVADLLGLLQQNGLEDPSLTNAPSEMTAKLGVKAAFTLSWQKLSSTAQYLAYLLSIGAADPMPWELVEEVDESFCFASEQPPQNLIDARRELLDLHLVQTAGDELFAMHRLIWEFFRGELQAKNNPIPPLGISFGNALHYAFVSVMVAIAKTIPQTPTLTLIAEVQPKIPHLAFVASNLTRFLPSEALVCPFIRLGRFYQGQGLYLQAEPWLQQCLEITEQQLGADHPDTAASLNNLAELYRATGRYREAELLYLRALEIEKQQLGADHPDTATSLNNLAELYRTTGRYREAELLYLRALEIEKQRLGVGHPSTATILNNLALLYQATGRYEEAEPLYICTLEVREQQLGADHPDTADSLNNLALLYQATGRYDKAEPLFIRALEVRE